MSASTVISTPVKAEQNRCPRRAFAAFCLLVDRESLPCTNRQSEEAAMHHLKTANIRSEFEPVVATASAQAAMMTLTAGAASDDEPSNEHPWAEQWLYVVSGAGVATVGRSRK